MQMALLKCKFITWIIEKRKVHPIGNRLFCWGFKNSGVLKNIANSTGKHLKKTSSVLWTLFWLLLTVWEMYFLNKCLPYNKAKWSSKQFWKIFLTKNMRWKRGWQLKSCLPLVYFHSYSFVTGIANMSSNIFISNVLLKNSTERNA